MFTHPHFFTFKSRGYFLTILKTEYLPHRLIHIASANVGSNPDFYKEVFSMKPFSKEAAEREYLRNPQGTP